MLRYNYFSKIFANGVDKDQRAVVHACCERLKIAHEKRNTLDVYVTSDGFVNLPYDEAMLARIKECAQKKRALSINTLVVIGIGGSSLGARALCGLIKPELRVVFLDTLDSDIGDIDWQRALVNVVSKTGTTLETIAWLEHVWPLLKRAHGADAAQYLVATTDRGSVLDSWAAGVGCERLYIPARIGGRFSVFTPVGLFSCALLCQDPRSPWYVDRLIQGAQYAVDQLMQGDIFKHDAVLSACMVEQQCRVGNFVNDLFVFGTPLGGVGGWQRQLIGESLGKKYTPEYPCSILPTVSIGSSDLHSVAQLYLGGVLPLVTTFVTVHNWHGHITSSADIGLVPELRAKKTFAGLMEILCAGTRAAYERQERPYIHVAWPDDGLFSLGQYMQNAMIQTVVLAEFFGVNPYDQPHVELYKKEARHLLREQ